MKTNLKNLKRTLKMKLKEFEDLAKKYDCWVMPGHDLDGWLYGLYAPKLADYRLATFYNNFQAAEMYTINGKQQFTNIEDLDKTYDESKENVYLADEKVVLYTKEKEYALVEYQKGKQTLSAERYLHYLNDFE